MNLDWALRNPTVWAIAITAGVVGAAISRDGRAWAFVRYAVLTFAVKALLPTSLSKYDWAPYFAYGLVLGAIAGALIIKATKQQRLVSTAQGAALGVAINLAIRLMTFV